MYTVNRAPYTPPTRVSIREPLGGSGFPRGTSAAFSWKLGTARPPPSTCSPLLLRVGVEARRAVGRSDLEVACFIPCEVLDSFLPGLLSVEAL